jgi:hypothetical protein
MYMLMVGMWREGWIWREGWMMDYAEMGRGLLGIKLLGTRLHGIKLHTT